MMTKVSTARLAKGNLDATINSANNSTRSTKRSTKRIRDEIMIVEKLIDYGRSIYTLLGERRKAERMDFNCSITVSCKDRYGQLTSRSCTCLNISQRGIGFMAPEP